MRCRSGTSVHPHNRLGAVVMLAIELALQIIVVPEWWWVQKRNLRHCIVNNAQRRVLLICLICTPQRIFR